MKLPEWLCMNAPSLLTIAVLGIIGIWTIAGLFFLVASLRAVCA